MMIIIVHFLWAKCLLIMLFIPRCIQYMVTSILLGHQYVFGVRSLLIVMKVLLVRNDMAVLLF